MATTHRKVMQDYNITIQSSKVAIDHQGVIVFRAGYGTQPDETWGKLFGELSRY